MLESHLEGPAWLGREEGAGWPARQGVPASVHTEHSGSTSPRRLLSRYLKAYPGVDQTQGLNQGKVLPHVPTQRLREGGSQQGKVGGRGGNEEPAEEEKKNTEELPI